MSGERETGRIEDAEDGRPCLLVVDDSAADLTRVTGLLEKECRGCRVVGCHRAIDGLDVLQRESVAAVITDLMMPEMTGQEFLVEIRRRFPSVPVILITSRGSDEIAARSLEMGAVDYVPKRSLADRLPEAVEEIFRCRREAELFGQVLSHLVSSRTVFHIDGCMDQLSSVLHHIRQHLQVLQCLQDQEVRLVTDSIREALMNACRHGVRQAGGHRTGTDGPAEIRLEVVQEGDCLRFVVSDSGPGFDTTCLDAVAGNGMAFMKRHMDEVVYSGAGNQVSLTKRFGRTQRG